MDAIRVDDWYRATLATSAIPAHTHAGLVDYFTQGLRPGAFLVAVLMNDLRGACRAADEENRPALPRYLAWLEDYAPAHAWGSPVAVEAWIAEHAPRITPAPASRS